MRCKSVFAALAALTVSASACDNATSAVPPLPDAGNGPGPGSGSGFTMDAGQPRQPDASFPDAGFPMVTDANTL